MELTINKQELINGLNRVSGAVKKFVTIEAKENIVLYSMNESFSISIECECDVKNEGIISVEYQRLYGFVKNYSGKEIKLKTTKAYWLHIEGDNIKMRLPGSAENQQLFEFKTLENVIKIKNIKEAINKTLFAVGTSASRVAFTGMNLDNGTITCANGFVIAQYKSDFEGINILVPGKSIKEIEKFASEESILSFNSTHIQIESGGLRFKSVLLEASYPNLGTVIGVENPIKITTKKEPLENFINIIEGIMSTAQDPIVKFCFSGNKINIISQKLDTGEGDGFVECDYSGSEINIGFNITFLKKTVQSFDDENIIFNIKDAESPVIITSNSDKNYRSAIMPVRIKW